MARSVSFDKTRPPLVQRVTLRPRPTATSRYNSIPVWGAWLAFILVILPFATSGLSLGRAATIPPNPVTTTLSIPISGTLSTDIEDISITGVLNIVTESTFAANSVFARVHTNVLNTSGIGLRTGQRFIAVGASLQTCGLPTTPNSAGRLFVDLTPQFRLVPLAPLAPAYKAIREGSLPLVLQVTFQSDGRLVDATVNVGRSRFALVQPGAETLSLRRRPANDYLASEPKV